MKTFWTLGFVFASLSYSHGALADGPFGISMGSDISDYQCKALQKLGFYECSGVPKPHVEFEGYMVQYSPQTGICWVKGIGGDRRSNSFGSSIRGAVDEVQGQISLNYGKPEKRDYLMEGSIWDDPEDWMMSMKKDERFYSYIWEGQKLPNNVKSVYLSASVKTQDAGYLIVEFSFLNEQRCEQEIKKKNSGSF